MLQSTLMRCVNCLKEIGPSFRYCPRCGSAVDARSPGGVATPIEPLEKLQYQNPRHVDSAQPIRSHFLAATIAAMLFPPFGIIAIIFSIRTLLHLSNQDFARARLSGHRARLFSRAGLVVIGAGVLLVLMLAMGERQ